MGWCNSRAASKWADGVDRRIRPIGPIRPIRPTCTGARILALVALAVVVVCVAAPVGAQRRTYLRLPLSVYRDKMRGAWIGQMVGVAWGGPTEFRWQDKIIPEADMPKWKPELINSAFGQDDLYVEMTFLRTLEQYGLDCSIRQAGIDFANSGYPLWCANNAGRTNLRNGIAPPDSSHPQFNKCPNDIDYQIEADYSGIIAPGLPNWPIRLGEKFGRLMNYGDGMYAGQFIGALYAAAYFETDLTKLVETALKAIPAESQYAEMVRDLVAWYRADPDDWQKAWGLIQRKYRQNPQYQLASNGGIDCKINGAYVLLGLLWGKGDPDQTIVISTRAGMDSDCNPSSSAGVLFAMMGASKLPARFTEALDEKPKFSHTAYDMPGLMRVCEQLTRQIVRKSGGRVVREGGEEVLLIPVEAPKPSAMELSWAPGPIAGSRFTKAEMKKIRFASFMEEMQKAVTRFAPGWKIAKCGPDMEPGLRAEWAGRKKVLATHPLERGIACTLARTVSVPRGHSAELRITVGHHPNGDFDLIVRADGKELLRKAVGPGTAPGGWMDATVDLTAYAGRAVALELVNEPTGWMCEAAYWAKIEVATERDRR